MATNNIILRISDSNENVLLETENKKPYYVGARAYVTQTAEGAIVTVIDRQGTTTAILLDGNQGRITDITYDADTQTIKKVNGVIVTDLVTLTDVGFDSDTNTIKRIHGDEESDLVVLADVAISNDYDDLDNTPDIDGDIEEWINANVDDTLTEAGYPADAKAVGDKIEAVKKSSIVSELVDNFNYAPTALSYDATDIDSGYYVNGGCFTDKYLVMAFHKTDYNDYIGVFDKDTLTLTTDISPNPFQFVNSQKVGDMTYNPNTDEVFLTSKESNTLYALDANTFALARTITLEVAVAEIAYDVEENCFVGIGSNDDSSAAHIFDSGFNLIRTWTFSTNATRQTLHAYGGLLWNLGYYSISNPILPSGGIVSVYDYYGTLHKEYILPTTLGEVEFHSVDPSNNCLYFGYNKNNNVLLYGTKYLNIFRGKDVTTSASGIKNTYDINFEESLRTQSTITIDTTKVTGTLSMIKSFNIAYCRLSLTLVSATQGMVIATVPEFAGASVLANVNLLTGSLGAAEAKYYGAIVMVNSSGEIKLYGDPDAFAVGNRIYGQVIVNCKP